MLAALAAAIVVVLLDNAVIAPSPLFAHLGSTDRTSLYSQVTVVSVTLLGFIVAAVAILVSLDPKRPIVGELRLGESFGLLVANMLAAILLLFIVTGMSLAGSVIDNSLHPAAVYETVFEILVLASIIELVLTGSLFSVVTYKVASKE